MIRLQWGKAECDSKGSSGIWKVLNSWVCLTLPPTTMKLLGALQIPASLLVYVYCECPIQRRGMGNCWKDLKAAVSTILSFVFPDTNLHKFPQLPMERPPRLAFHCLFRVLCGNFSLPSIPISYPQYTCSALHFLQHFHVCLMNNMERIVRCSGNSHIERAFEFCASLVREIAYVAAD